MRNSEFTKVSEILPAILRKIGLARRLEEREVLALWEEVVGEEIAARTEAVKCARGVLHVYVSHGAWMQELHFMEKEIVRRFAEKAPGVNVQKIRFSSMKQN
jgi:predicted nucleic acid-binding Zn ribbon protein